MKAKQVILENKFLDWTKFVDYLGLVVKILISNFQYIVCSLYFANSILSH